MRGAGALAAATIAIGAANYATSIAAAHGLAAAQFEDFAAGQGLLMVLGTGCFAGLPWAVARYLARGTTEDDAVRAGRAMTFGLLGALVQGTVLAAIAAAVCWSIGGTLLAAAGGLAALLISFLAAPVGFLQGRGSVSTIAVARGIETAVRVAVTVALLVLGATHAGLLLFAFPLASLAALGYALHRSREGFPLRPIGGKRALRLTREALLLGGIQVLLAMLGALDTVYVELGNLSPSQGASYQAAALFARIPLFFSAAVSTAVFAHLVASADDTDAGAHLRSAARTYLWLSLPFVVAYLTVPSRALDVLVPFGQTGDILRIVGFAGVLVGLVNVVTTGHQARGEYRACLLVLGVFVLVQGVLLWTLANSGHLLAFASAETSVCGAAAIAVCVDARRWWRGSWRSGNGLAAAPTCLVVIATVAAAHAQGRIAVWASAIVLVAFGSLAAAFLHHDARPVRIHGAPTHRAVEDPR